MGKTDSYVGIIMTAIHAVETQRTARKKPQIIVRLSYQLYVELIYAFRINPVQSTFCGYPVEVGSYTEKGLFFSILVNELSGKIPDTIDTNSTI